MAQASIIESSLWYSLKTGPLKAFVIGGGNWGTAISGLIAKNAKASYIFETTVHMWLRQEQFNGKNLTDIINQTHENPKYLPNILLPDNLIAVSDFSPYISNADLIIIVLPHQFVDSVCHQLHGHIKPSAKAVSLVKGIKVNNGRPELFTRSISQLLGVPCSILSGANVANNIAKKEFSESTLGYLDSEKETAAVWQQLFDTPYFKINGVPDIHGVELCGALKNVVALAAGFCEGLNLGTNTKSAIIRLGVEEIKIFANLFFDGILEETFFDSSGYADVITTCFGGIIKYERGRNVRCAVEFVKRQGIDDWDKIEEDLLHGQKMQGQLTCKDIYEVIEKHGLQQMMPLFTTTYKIAFEKESPWSIISTFSVEATRPLKLLSDCNKCIVSKSLQKQRKKSFLPITSFQAE